MNSATSLPTSTNPGCEGSLSRTLNKQIARSRLLDFLSAVILILASTALQSQAVTVLTGLPVTNQPVPASHGSNAPGTPNISVTWDANWDQYANWRGVSGNDVYQNDAASHTLTFTPDAGWDVSLLSLELENWDGPTLNVNWLVVGSVSGNLGSGVFVQSNNTFGTHVINVVGSGAETLTLTLNGGASSAGFLATDDITFDQIAIPEPSPAILGLLAGVMPLLRRIR